MIRYSEKYSMASLTNREEDQFFQSFKFKKVVKPEPLTAQNVQSRRIRHPHNSLHDKENLNARLQQLKQQNGQLSQIVKVQRTQIKQLKEKQLRFLKSFEKNHQENKSCKLRIMTHRMSEKIKNLEEQIQALKKKMKYTKIKELQAQNVQYLEQIKQLTSRVKALSHSHKMEQLNKIIEEEYFTSLKNNHLLQIISDQKNELSKNLRLIRRLNNGINAKDRQIKEIKDNLSDLNKNQNRGKHIKSFPHKDVQKRKQSKNKEDIEESWQIFENDIHDSPENASKVKSFLKKMVNNKNLFTEQQERNFCRQINEFYRQKVSIIEANLANLYEKKSSKTIGKFLRNHIIEAFQNQHELPEKIINYIYYKTFDDRSKKLTLQQFIRRFPYPKQLPTFLTENHYDC